MKNKISRILKLVVLFTLFLAFFQKTQFKVSAQLAPPFQCGSTFTSPAYSAEDCVCANVDYIQHFDNPPTDFWCCGWHYNNYCNASPPPTAAPTATPTLAVPIPPVDQELLDNLNPLKLFSTKAEKLSTPGGIISEVLKYAFPIAGMILFGMLVLAGVKMLTGATNSKNMDEGKQIITTAIIGFIILFASYWIIQLIEVVFGIAILGV